MMTTLHQSYKLHSSLLFNSHFGYTTSLYLLFFFFNDTATPEFYPLSLHDALPIWGDAAALDGEARRADPTPAPAAGRARRSRRRPEPPLPPLPRDLHGLPGASRGGADPDREDRKSTRLNSRHSQISYAGFCLKKKA